MGCQGGSSGSCLPFLLVEGKGRVAGILSSQELRHLLTGSLGAYFPATQDKEMLSWTHSETLSCIPVFLLQFILALL